MQTLHTAIAIKATPENIWNVLVVSPAIPHEIRNAIQDRKIGQILTVPMSTGGRSVTLTVKLLIVDPFREIRWKGFLWIPGLFDGEHSFEILEDRKGISQLVQRETFSGILVPFFPKVIADTKREFETVNARIRDTAERG
jgi:hypothetical protein